MDQLIPVINRLSTVLDAANGSQRLDSIIFDLPTIVVIGSQSAGKSSVLEGLVGRDFLPRGRDIVTRRPLILHLYFDTEEYATFSHTSGDRRFTDFDMVRREIELETERVAGKNKGISRDPIHLAIHSPNVIPLTLVDLPGITKIPVGDQPADIESQLRQMIMEYACRPHALLLAITPANTDLTNSDALKLAREVDPSGQRTIGVLTKLDLMDAGTNALDILQNRGSFKLRHGFVGVVMRSQQDINNSVPISAALKKEGAFLAQQYRVLGNRCGIHHLATELNKYIKSLLPDIKSRINGMMLACQSELMSFGDSDQRIGQKGSLLLRLVTLYVTDFEEAIQGTSKTLHSTDEYIGGAKLSHIFTNIHHATIMSMDAADDLTVDQGPRPAIFIPEGSFEVLIKKQIGRLEEPCLRCVEMVYDELHRLLSKTSRTELKRYPNLTLKMVEVSGALLRERIKPTNEMVQSLVRIEQAYINTSHPDFITTGPAFQAVAKIVEDRRRKDFEQSMSMSSEDIPMTTVAQSVQSPPAKEGGLLSYLFKPQPSTYPSPPHHIVVSSQAAQSVKKPRHKQEQLSEREEFETQLIMSLLHGYFAIVKKNLVDSVPKATMFFLVNHVIEQLPTRLVSELYKEELFGDLLKEDEHIVRQRVRCRRDLDVLQNALVVLNEVREYA